MRAVFHLFRLLRKRERNRTPLLCGSGINQLLQEVLSVAFQSEHQYQRQRSHTPWGVDDNGGNVAAPDILDISDDNISIVSLCTSVSQFN